MSRRSLSTWGPFLAALAIVFWLSSLTRVPGVSFGWDKLLHALGYTVLGLLTLRAFHGGFERLRGRPTAAAAVFMTAWSISDEFHQSFVPGRDASGADVVADLVGFSIACVLLYAWGERQRRMASADA